MKRLLLISLVLLAMLGSGSCAWGAIHSFNGDVLGWSFSEYSMGLSLEFQWATDTRFTTEPDPAKFWGNGFVVTDQVSFIGLGYYQDDFIFAEVANISPDSSDSATLIRGSYLFDFGLLVGLDYCSDYSGATAYVIAPGYAYKFDDNSYAALSLDYLSAPDEDFNEVVAYDLDFKYYGDGIKAYLQYYIVTDENPFVPDDVYDIGLAYQVSDEVTIGLSGYGWSDETNLFAGLTWINDLVIFDAGIGSDTGDDETYYDLSAIFKFAETMGAGLEYLQYSEDDDAQIIIKFRYLTDESKFGLNYGLENDTYPAMYNLTYQQNF